MKLPGWIPVWLIRLLTAVFGGEAVPALECDCGALFEMFPGETVAQVAARLEAHNRFFHPERVSSDA